MAAHRTELARGPSKQFRGALADVSMRSSVEPVTRDATLAPRSRYAIDRSVRGHGGVEFGLKGRHQRHTGQHLRERANGLQIDGVVSGGRGPKLFERSDHAAVHGVSASVLRPAVYGLERDGVHANFAGLHLSDAVAVVSNPLQAALGQHLPGGHVEDLVLERRRPEVRDQDVHYFTARYWLLMTATFLAACAWKLLLMAAHCWLNFSASTMFSIL